MIRMRTAFTLIELLVVIAIIAVLLAFAIEVPFVTGPLRVLFYLLFGWVFALIRMDGAASLDTQNTALAATCMVLLIPGTHIAGRWLYNREASRTWSWRWTFAGLALVLVAAVTGICAVAITHQSVWLARIDAPWITTRPPDAAPKTASLNNLKQIALAAVNYHDTQKRFPLGGAFDAHGRGMHGWQVHLLPYIEENALYKEIDLTRPWDSPVNVPAMKRHLPIFLIPLVEVPSSEGPAPSHYAANVHVIGAKPMRLQDITDGTSNTLLAGEAAGNFKAWGQPGNWRDPAAGINKSPDTFGRPTGGYACFVFADSSVRTISDTASPAFLRAISTPAGGEPVLLDE